MSEDAGAANVERALNKAIEQYNKVTGKSVQLDNKMTVEEMTADMVQLDLGRLDGQKSEIFKNTMETLVNLGSVAADAAAMAWPPASLCYKALQPILDTAENYQKYYTTEVLFETLDSVLKILKRVTTYLEGSRRGAQIDENLEDTIIRLLARFVTICAIYAKVGRDSQSLKGKIGNVLKAAVHYDGGITSQLKAIEKLEAEEMQINTIQTRTAATITGNFLQADRNDKVQAQYRIVISEKLPFDNKSPAWDSWVAVHDKIRRDIQAGFGAWFFREDAFRAWSDIERDTSSCKPVFALEGRSGSGKSYLCSEVVQNLHQKLKRQERHDSRPRVSIVYFYFGKRDTGKTQKTEEKDKTAKKKATIHDALTAVIWQLAESDTSYQSFIHGQCANNPAHFSSTSERWENLVMNYAEPKASKSRKVFFIILDGIDQAGYATKHEVEEILSEIIDKTAQLRSKQVQVRLFITGNSKSFKGLREQQKEDVIEFFMLKSYEDAQNTQKRIKSRIKDVSDTRGKDFERDQLLQNLEVKLCKNYSEDPTTVTAVLDRISRFKRKRDLKEILDSDWDDYKTTIQWQTDVLNEELQDEEIEDLNDIMSCVASLRIWPSLEQLKTFIFLRTGRVSETPLEEQIQSKFNRLFEIEIPEDEIIAPYDMFDYLLNESRPFERSKPSRGVIKAPDRSSENSSTQLSESEINLMKDLVRSNYGEEVFKKFRFEQHFSQLRREQHGRPRLRPTIGFDSIESHVRIIVRLLRAVSSPEYRDESEVLHGYTADHLFQHLGEVREIHKLDKSKRLEIGKLLYQFFHERPAVENWLETILIDDVNVWRHFFAEVLRWFGDTEVSLGAIGPSDGSRPDANVCLTAHHLLDMPLKVLASHWLQRNVWEAKAAYTWFLGLRDEEQRSKSKEEPVQPANLENSPVAEEPGIQPDVVTTPEPTTQAETIAQPGSIAQQEPDTTKQDLSAEPESTNLVQETTVSQPIHVIETWPPANATASHPTDSSGPTEPHSPLETPRHTVETSASIFHSIMESAGYASSLLAISNDERDFKWHLRIGETVLEHGLYADAIRSCNKSIELLNESGNQEDDEWRIYWCLVRASPDNIEKGIESLGKLFEKFKDQKYIKTHPVEVENMVMALWELYNDKWERPSEAMKACHELLVGGADKSWLMDRAWEVIDAKRDPAFLHDISGTPAGGGPSPLTTLFQNRASDESFHNTLASILKTELGLLMKVYIDAIQAAESDAFVRSHLRYYYAIALVYQNCVEEACIIWEKNVYDESITIGQDNHGASLHMRVLSLQRLLSEYSQSTRNKTVQGQETGLSNKLKTFGRWINDAFGDSDHPVTVLLGRAYYVAREEQLAKECMRAYVNTALELLSDETTDNDWQGFYMLTQATAAIDEDERALAAWQLVNPTTESGWECDGACGRFDRKHMDLYACKDCIDVQFEQSCFEKLRSGTLDVRVCGKTHRFVKLPKLDTKALKETEKGLVHEQTIQDWLHDIKHLFGIKSSGGEVLVRPERPLLQEVKTLVRVLKGRTRRGMKHAIG